MFSRYLATAGFILATDAGALDIPIVFLSRAEEPRLPLSFVDPVVEDPGVRGARLAIKDNQTTGGFLVQTYELIEDVLPRDGDITAAFAGHVAAGRRLFIADLTRDDQLAIARHPDAAARKFGAKIVAEESYAYDPIARRTDSIGRVADHRPGLRARHRQARCRSAGPPGRS